MEPVILLGMRLLLVDGHYYLYRSFFAIRGLSNSRGEPTNAIYGYAKALRRMLSDLKPDAAAVVWDAGLPAHRTELQPEYKQNREEMPADLRPQGEWLQRNVPLFGPASLELPETEADDLIASYALAASREGASVVVATNDKDLLQIVDENIRIYSTAKADVAEGGFALLDREAVRRKWGVEPSRIADVLALTGDASDNIPGVPGIGPKTAAQLVVAHGSVESMLAAPETIRNPRQRDAVVAARDLIVSNLAMVRLETDLPLPRPWREFVPTPRYPELIAALRDCEFKGLLAEVEREAEVASRAVQGDLFG